MSLTKSEVASEKKTQVAVLVQQLFAKKRQSSELFWNKLEIGTYTPYDPYIY